MPIVTTSYWYDSSNDEYEIPVVYLGVLDEYPDVTEDSNPSVSNISLFLGRSSSLSFKGAITGTFPAVVAPANEIVRALGRYGTFYPSSDTISSDNYFRVSEISGGRVSYYACATDSDNVSNVDSTDSGATAYCLGLGTIGDKVYLGIYAYGTGIGGDEHSAWIFAYNAENYQAWNVLNSLLKIDPVPGQKSFKPTGTRYKHTKPGIGGRGHGATHKGQTPAYPTDVLTNPGAPDESVASVIGAGLIHPYKIDTANLGNLTTCLYGTTLGGLITNLAIDPLDFIISLNIFPCSPDVGTSTNVTLGKWVCTDSGVDSLGGNVVASPLTAQFKTISFGSISVFENWGNFLDYSNTSIELYLPFIGFVDIDPAEVMEGTIAVDYTIDFLTGMCVANVNCNKYVETPDGYFYPQSSQHAYQGNCAITVPLSQMQYGQMIGSLINAGVQGLRGNALGVGVGVGEAMASAISPQTTTKGCITANAGFCSVLYPYIRITRPISSEPESYQEVMGYPSYIDSTLGECDDLCICESIDLHTITGATDSELERIRQMCLEGVHV